MENEINLALMMSSIALGLSIGTFIFINMLKTHIKVLELEMDNYRVLIIQNIIKELEGIKR